MAGTRFAEGQGMTWQNVIGWICGIVAVCLWWGCDRPPRPNAAELLIGQNDLQQLTNELNRNIAEGRLRGLDSGANTYTLDFRGAPRLYTASVTLDPRVVIVPLGVATVRINALRFREATARWNVTENALEVRLLIQNKADGIIGKLRVLGIDQDLKFFVEGGQAILYLEPRIGNDGTLDFAPVRGKFVANTDDAIPAVRDAVRENMQAISDILTQEAQIHFNRYRSDLEAWFASQLAPDTVLTFIRIASDAATFHARFLADVNSDGFVDIADLVVVARQFGENGPPRFSVADVTGDGSVDIADLVSVARRFGVSAAPGLRLRPDRTR
jgi:hypothetical protein